MGALPFVKERLAIPRAHSELYESRGNSSNPRRKRPFCVGRSVLLPFGPQTTSGFALSPAAGRSDFLASGVEFPSEFRVFLGKTNLKRWTLRLRLKKFNCVSLSPQRR
jgi:hypothetical protein